MNIQNKIFAGGFFLSIAYGVTFLIPLYFNSLGKFQDLTGFFLGILGVGAIVATLLSRVASVRFSNKSVLLWGCTCFALGLLFFSLSQISIFWLSISALLMGIGWGVYYNVSSIVISLQANPDNRAILFGYLSAFNVLGASFTPIFFRYFFLQVIDYQFVFQFSIFASIISFIFFVGLPPQQNDTVKKNVNSKLKKITTFALGKHLAIFPIAIAFLIGCAFSLLTNFQTVFAEANGLNYAYFFVTYCVVVIFSRFTVSKILAKYNSYFTLILLMTVMLIALLLFAYSAHQTLVYVISAMLFGFSYGLVYPIAQSITVSLTEDIHHASVITYFTFAALIGAFLFPFIAGMLITYYGFIIAIAAVIMLVAWALFFSFILLILFMRIDKCKDNV